MDALSPLGDHAHRHAADARKGLARHPGREAGVVNLSGAGRKRYRGRQGRGLELYQRSLEDRSCLPDVRRDERSMTRTISTQRSASRSVRCAASSRSRSCSNRGRRQSHGYEDQRRRIGKRRRSGRRRRSYRQTAMTATILDWKGTASMRGPVATVGGRVLDTQAHRVISTTFENVKNRLSGSALSRMNARELLRAGRRTGTRAQTVRPGDRRRTRSAPVSAHLGDRAIVLADGRMQGFVGGSCSRDIVRRQAVEAMRSGMPRLVQIRPVRRPSRRASTGTVVVR